MPRSPIPKSSHTRASGLLDLIHSDIAGPLPVSSRGGAQYYRHAERQTGRKIKALRSDGGGEYTSNEFQAYLDDNGIAQQLTVPYTPQQNGVAERMNRTLKDLMRSMLLHKNVSQDLWADAVVTAAKCWYKLNDPRVRGLDSRTSEAIFLGYATNQKGYKLLNESKGEIIVSRDVKFDENSSLNAEISDPSKIAEDTEPDEDSSPSYTPGAESAKEDADSDNESSL
eukprot:IDg22896t1